MEITRRFVTRRTKVINKGDRLRTEIDQSLETVFIEPGLGRQVREYKVVFLGTSNVGKSSIISQFLRTEHDDVFGREFLRLPGGAGDRVVLVDVNGSVSKLSIAEREELEEEGEKPDCLVLVYSIEDQKSFDFALSILARLENSGELGSGVILVGNKTDLARSRQVKSKEGRNLALLYGLKFIETGAGIGHNIEQLLVGIVIQSRRRDKQKQMNENILKEKLKGFFDTQKRKLSTKKKKVMNLNI